MYYEVQVEIKTETESGKVRKNKETYLVQALSVVEAEANLTKDFEEYGDNWNVKSVKESKIVRVI
jgi:hypothetical protein